MRGASARATLKVLAQPQMRERLKDIGFEVGQPRSSDEMSKSLRTDYERVGAMLKAINFKPELVLRPSRGLSTSSLPTIACHGWAAWNSCAASGRGTSRAKFSFFPLTSPMRIFVPTRSSASTL